MKKALVGVLALVMCLGLASCSKGSSDTPSLAEIVEKAKTDGANWSIDEWKEAYRNVLLAVKPMMEEIAEIQKSVPDDDDGTKALAAIAKIAELQNKYGDVDKLMNEFTQVAESNENGKKVMEDEEFGKKLFKELGLPEEALE
jgi:ABC-type uncharacterized transport system YnjBCD substrate-binding protein